MNIKRLNFADIRVVIGSVLGIIGVFLLACSAAVAPATLPEYITVNDPELNATAINVNLYAGVFMVVVSLVMGVWALMSSEGGKSPQTPDQISDSKKK